MIRPLRTLLAVAFLAGGAALGALNPAPVTLDLGLLRFEASLGVVLLAVLLVGVLIGGLALTVSVVLPMRHRYRRERKDAAKATQGVAGTKSAHSMDARMSEPRLTQAGGFEDELHD
jgi:lipopolysaccharide assembly protein A